MDRGQATQSDRHWLSFNRQWQDSDRFLGDQDQAKIFAARVAYSAKESFETISICHHQLIYIVEEDEEPVVQRGAMLR